MELNPSQLTTSIEPCLKVKVWIIEAALDNEGWHGSTHWTVSYHKYLARTMVGGGESSEVPYFNGYASYRIVITPHDDHTQKMREAG